jgi:DNA polymerase-3 subunit alpha
MKELIRRLLPENIDDIIALVALFRPGPLESGAVDDYINRKHGTEAVSFPHPSLEPVLESTYGVVLYQEQVMQIAQVLAGFSLGQADLLRRAMGKKKASEMAKVREQFLAGTAENDVSAGLANEIFDLMEKFAGYAFNKSHSATYAIVSFQTAWLKSRYPAHFMAANLSADMQTIDRVVILVDEVRRMKMSLLPPDVNISQFRFSVKGEAVIYGLGAVRGVGEGPVSAIVEARVRGPYLDLADFCRRVDSKKANKRVLLALISSGAMDEFALADETLNQTRARLLATLPQAVRGAEQVARDRAVGITDLFGGIESQPAVQDFEVQSMAKPLTTLERLGGEKDTLGLYLTGHPIESYEKELGHFCRSKIKDLRASKNTQWVAGMVISNRVMKNKRGSSMAFLVLDDRSARLEVSLFSDAFQNYVHKVSKDELLVIEGEIQSDERNGGITLRASQVLTMDEARQKFSRGLALDFTASQLPVNFNQKLKEILQPYQVPGATCPVAILYKAEEAQGKISLGPEWHVKVSQQLLFDLEENFGDEKVSLNYPQGRNFG